MGAYFYLPEKELKGDSQYHVVADDDNYEGWVRNYGETEIIIFPRFNTYIEFKGQKGEVYGITYNYFDDTIYTDTPEGFSLYCKLLWFGYYNYLHIEIVQKQEFTRTGTCPLKWVIYIHSNFDFSSFTITNSSYVEVLTPTNSKTIKNSSTNSEIKVLPSQDAPSYPGQLVTLTEEPNLPRLQVQFTVLGDFKDLSSVTFHIEDGVSHGCVKSCYKQLIGTSDNSIHVLSPTILCYLAGEGDFTTQKMSSVNGTQEAVWPQVSLYAMSKFILNRLLNRRFNMSIVLRKNTKVFMKQLKESRYSNFLEYFELNKDLEKYFL